MSIFPPYQDPRSSRSSRWLPFLGAALLATLAGCNGSSTSTSSSTPTSTTSGPGLQGTLYGGRQPIVGSTVLVYESGLNAGDAPTQIGSATTDSNGQFNVASFSPTPSSSQLIYLAAIGGNAGGGTNSNVNLMTVAGTYGALPSSVNITELTTIASTSQLGSLLQEVGCSSIAGTTQFTGICPSIAGSASLGTALSNITTLVDVTYGTASTTLTSASSGSAAYTALQTMDTLADILAACVNSSGGYANNTSSACGKLFSTTELSTVNNVAANGSDITFNPYPDEMSGIVATPDGQFVIAIDNTGAIKTYGINQSTGVLTLKQTLTMAGTSPEPWGIAVSPDGSHVFINDEFNGLVYAYSLNSSTGALTQTSVQYVDGSSSSSPNDYPDALTVSPDGKFLYVVLSNNAKIGLFSISGGSLTHVSNPSVGDYPNMIVFAPGGKFAYVANSGDNTVSQFSVNTSTGALTSLGADIAAGVDPLGIAITPDGKYAYVVNNGSTASTVSVFTVNTSTGILASASSTTVTAGGSGGIAYSNTDVMSPDGTTLYVISSGDGSSTHGGVDSFTINSSSGILSHKAFVATGAHDTTDGLGSGTYTMAITPNGKYGYTQNENVDSISSLTLVAGVADTGNAAWSITNNSSINTSGSTIFAEMALPLVYSPVLSAAPSNWTITP